MTFKNIPRISPGSFTGNNEVDDIRRSVENAKSALLKVPFLQGRLLDAYTFTAGETKSFEHKLGRAFQGWFVVNTIKSSAAYAQIRTAAQPSGLTNDTHVTVISGAAGTFQLWVF